ncbi:hypothetical protein Mkiyose1595_56890 [Mycobacterium kiyosense]|nr:hypothetical protein Mkiyose1595_56890 [Mycobacterium kiyosense]
MLSVNPCDDESDTFIAATPSRPAICSGGNRNCGSSDTAAGGAMVGVADVLAGDDVGAAEEGGAAERGAGERMIMVTARATAATITVRPAAAATMRPPVSP